MHGNEVKDEIDERPELRNAIKEHGSQLLSFMLDHNDISVSGLCCAVLKVVPKPI